MSTVKEDRETILQQARARIWPKMARVLKMTDAELAEFMTQQKKKSAAANF